MEPHFKNHPSPRSTSVPVPGLADCSLSGGVKSTSEVGTNLSTHPGCDFDISMNNLPEKLGFSPEFQAELKAVEGNI